MSLSSTAIGIGFKSEHFSALTSDPDRVSFVEVHAENYMGAGGLPHAQLTHLRENHGLSIHGVGLSIGGSRGLDRDHLARLKTLCDRYEPDLFSEHLAWSSHGADYLNDLLPLPYTDETLDIVCDHIDLVQETLGRKMLLENPSTYVLFEQSTMTETDFLAAIVRRTGCGLLLDVNNVFVSCTNHREDPRAYLAAFPTEAVGEIHLGGHDTEDLPSGPLLIDSHGRPVAEPVWTLYEELTAAKGPTPTLIEWDTDVPEWSELAAEADRAAQILNSGGIAYDRAS